MIGFLEASLALFLCSSPMSLQAPSNPPSDSMAKSQNIENTTSFSQIGEKYRDLGSDHHLTSEPSPRSSSHLKKTLTIALVGVVVLLKSGFRFQMGESGSQEMGLANTDTDQAR